MKKYEYIFKKLEHDINAGVYQAGDYLPTENELTKTYQVSRDTIRIHMFQAKKFRKK